MHFIFNKEFCNGEFLEKAYDYATKKGKEMLDFYWRNYPGTYVYVQEETRKKGFINAQAALEFFAGCILMEYDIKEKSAIKTDKARSIWATKEGKQGNGALSEGKDSDQSRMVEYFAPETPFFLNVDRFMRRLLLSSSLLVHPNEKMILAVMVKKEYVSVGKMWTPEEIISEAKKYGPFEFNEKKVRKCLEKKHKRKISKEGKAEVCFYKKTEDGKYQLDLTTLIKYDYWNYNAGNTVNTEN